MVKQSPSPTVATNMPAMVGPTMRARLNITEFSEMALRKSSLADHFDGEGLARGHIEGVDEALEQGQRNDLPDLNDAHERKHGQGRRLQHGKGLRDHQKFSAIHAVGNHASERGDEEHRHLAAERHHAEQEGRMRHRIDEPALRDRCNPGAHQRNKLARKEQSVIAVAEDLQKARCGGACASPFGRRGFFGRGRDGFVFGCHAATTPALARDARR